MVFRSLKNIEGQLIDDDASRTLAGISTLAPAVKEEAGAKSKSKVDLARVAGRLLAERAREAGIGRVVFDRGGYQYHGRVEAFAAGAREGGLVF